MPTPMSFASISLSILALFLIFQHIEVRGVARLTDVMLLHSLAHGTVGLSAIGTVAILALVGELENFREVVANLFNLHVEGAKALDAWSVDDVTSARYLVHFREGGGVHALFVGSGDNPCAGFNV